MTMLITLHTRQQWTDCTSEWVKTAELHNSLHHHAPVCRVFICTCLHVQHLSARAGTGGQSLVNRPAHRQCTLGHRQCTLGRRKCTLGYKQCTLSHRQCTSGYRQCTLGHRQYALGHRQCTLGHKQCTLGHRQCNLGHRQCTSHTPSLAFRHPALLEEGCRNPMLRVWILHSTCVVLWFMRLAIAGSVVGQQHVSRFSQKRVVMVCGHCVMTFPSQ